MQLPHRDKNMFEDDVFSFDYLVRNITKPWAFNNIRRTLLPDVIFQSCPRFLINSLAHAFRCEAGIQFQICKQLNQKSGSRSPNTGDYHMPAWLVHCVGIICLPLLAEATSLRMG